MGVPAAQILSGNTRLGLRERVAARLADPHPQSSESQIYADMGFIDGLLTPQGDSWAFVRRQLLPPAEVLDEQSRHGARKRARTPLARCAGVLARYSVTLGRALRSPTRLPS